MAELSAEIVVSANQAQAQFNKAKKGAEQLEREFKQAGIAADRLGDAVQKTGRQIGGFSQFIFQSGQAVSDFAVAGVLGAANNIEFLAQQFVQLRRKAGGTRAFFRSLTGALAGPAGLIAVISAASAAILIFGDDIDKVLRPLNAQIEKSKQALQGLLKIAESGVVTGVTLANLNEANRALEEQEEIVRRLEESTKRTRIQLQFLRISPFSRSFGLSITDAEQRLADARAVLDDINKQIDELEDKERVFESALKNPVIAARQELEQNEEIVKELLKLYDELRKNEKERASGVDKLREKNKALREEFSALLSIDQAILGELLKQNSALEAQIRLVKFLAEERARGGGQLGVSGLRSFTGAGVQQQGAESDPATFIPEGASDRLVEILTANAENQPSPFAALLRDAPSAVTELDKVGESTQRLIELNENLSTTIQGSVASAFSSLASAAVSGDNVFKALGASIGQFAIDVGETLIAFGVSGIALKAFVSNPAGAIIAGSALVALGTALKNQVEKKTESFTARGQSTGPATPGIVDPRQGRDGRFRRDTSSLDFNEFRLPESLRIEVFGQFGLVGSNLVAAVDRTRRRQTRTKGD